MNASNDTEVILFNLITTYKLQMGSGFEPTMAHILLALGACFSLLCLMGAIINLYLAGHSIPRVIWKGLLFIQLVIFSACFIIMALFTFFIPVLLNGIILISLFIARYGTREHFTIG